jgi:hypothetical protein
MQTKLTINVFVAILIAILLDMVTTVPKGFEPVDVFFGISLYS